MNESELLSIRDLTIAYRQREGSEIATAPVSLTVGASQIVGLQGPSGSGKTSLALAILGVLPPNARVRSGRIRFKGLNLPELTEQELRRIRGRQIALVFQEPLAALNPLLTIGAQVREGLRAHQALDRVTTHERMLALLDEVGLDDSSSLCERYPHQISGGQRQRVLIASALAGDPDLLVCDEPTAALDQPHQLKVLDLLADLRLRRQLSILLISHNRRVVDYLADRCVQMLRANGGVSSEP